MESKIKQTAINFVQTEYAPYHKLDLNDKTCFDAEVKHYEEFAKYIFEQGSIQSPDADNTERGERPSIKDYFPESFGVMDILPIYESQPELFNYAKALDRYIDDIENPTPPTLLNELRENADLLAEAVSLLSDIQKIAKIAQWDDSFTGRNVIYSKLVDFLLKYEQNKK